MGEGYNTALEPYIYYPRGSLKTIKFNAIKVGLSLKVDLSFSRIMFKITFCARGGDIRRGYSGPMEEDSMISMKAYVQLRDWHKLHPESKFVMKQAALWSVKSLFGPQPEPATNHKASWRLVPL